MLPVSFTWTLTSSPILGSHQQHWINILADNSTCTSFRVSENKFLWVDFLGGQISISLRFLPNCPPETNWFVSSSSPSEGCPLSPSDCSNCSLPGLCDTLSYLGHRLYKSWFITFSCHINPMRQGLLAPPFYRQGDQGSARVSNLPKVTQLLASSDWRAWLGTVLKGSCPFAFSTSSLPSLDSCPIPNSCFLLSWVSHSSLLLPHPLYEDGFQVCTLVQFSFHEFLFPSLSLVGVSESQ